MDGGVIREVEDAQLAGGQGERVRRMLAVGDALLERLEQAVRELDRTVVKQRKQEKTVRSGVTDNEKYSEEVVCETDGIVVCDAPVDRAGLKQLVATLAELREALLPSAQGDGGALKVVFAPEVEEMGG